MGWEPDVFIGTDGRWPDAVRLKNLKEDESRRYVPDESVAAELCYVEDTSRWYELFGTPERAARTLFAMCHGMRDCGFCPIGRAEGGNCSSCDEMKTILEWLSGDA